MKNLEDPLIDVVVEYAGAEEKANMIMRFNGAELKESDIQNELSLSMLMSFARNFNYDRSDAEDYPNRFTFEVDNKSISR